ncbi:MAG TPA: cardiolipin synthase [Povalibacter sp.]|uniref:cardiolipin synthase n=1 Tax=Povalibacter sp. TaxID=1962978 RepID=UPI002BE417B1|nr:cardiolipin synthase [Povalibacter sp.]HMN44947.1 cardiolipin synthase [Povalibacter sp.]
MSSSLSSPQFLHRLAPAFVALLCCACAAPKARPVDPAAAAPAVVVATGALSDARGERLIERRLGDEYDDPHVRELIDAFRAQAEAPLVAGNRVNLLIDGPQTLQAIRKAIEGAQHSIHVETYIFASDPVGSEFADLLIARRRAGLEVRVIYDAVGSVTTPGEFFDRMREAGVEVREFRPLDPVRTPLPWKINNRDHRKIVVVDGRIAFTGGINISSTYESSSATRPGPEAGRDEAWRDTHVEIVGPVAAQFQALFFATWTRAGGKVDTRNPLYFPAIEPAGGELVAAVATDADDKSETRIYATYLEVMKHSSRRLWLTNAYFAPNKEMRQELIAAAKRGVDVRLIVPGFTDSGLILHASRSTFDELLAGGVRIYEQRYALLHAKTAVIDTALSMVGSANLDMRSFLHNNEVNAVVVGSGFAQKLEAVFERDLKDSRELDLETWRERPFSDKVKESASSLLSYWL